jgi:hypothetical protein
MLEALDPKKAGGFFVLVPAPDGQRRAAHAVFRTRSYQTPGRGNVAVARLPAKGRLIGARRLKPDSWHPNWHRTS